MKNWFINRGSILIHLATVLIGAGLVYVAWLYVGSRINWDYPTNTLAGSMEWVVRLVVSVIVAWTLMLLFNLLVLVLPRVIRRRRFWKRKLAGK